MTKKTVNFGSEESYHRWLRYGFAHDLFHGPGENVKIAGKPHKVNHKK